MEVEQRTTKKDKHLNKLMVAMWRAVSRLRGASALRGAVRLSSLLASPPTALLPSASLLLPVVVNIGQQSSGSRCLQPWLAMVGLASAAAVFAEPALAMPVTASKSGDADEDAGQAEAELAYRVAPSIRTKYGRYPPWCRLNVDQVPLPFVNDMDTTYEERGAKRVTINQLGPALSKRQATGQICFRPSVPPPVGCTTSQARKLYDNYLMAQPAPCILFRGKGNISELERSAYPRTPLGWLCCGKISRGWTGRSLSSGRKTSSNPSSRQSARQVWQMSRLATCCFRIIWTRRNRQTTSSSLPTGELTTTSYHQMRRIRPNQSIVDSGVK